MKTRRGLQGKRVYVRCKSKRLFEFMGQYLSWKGKKKSKSVELDDLPSHSVNFLFGFLCGMIDSDGATKRLYISTSSQKLATNLIGICNILGIAAKTYRYDVYHVHLRKHDFKRVCQKYGFSSNKHK